jgi:hypothetical protein
VVARHEVLRTRFVAVDGEPRQAISPPPATVRPGDLPLIDLSGLGEERRRSEAARLARRDARRPFDLARGPLFRVTLVRLAPERHLTLFTLHHAVSDAWSMGVLVGELSELYEARVEGRPPALPEMPIQYADFAVWQRRWLSGDTLEAELDWWRGRLAGMPPALEVPTDRPRPPVQSLHGSAESVTLPAELVEGLRRLSREQGTTLFMTLLAAFAVQLRHHSGRDDVVIGTNVANRDRVQVEGLIGFFVNQLVLRADLSGDPTFAGLLARVRGVVLESVEHQHVPFEKLVEELQPPRERGRSLLYQFKLEVADGGGGGRREPARLGPLAVEPYTLADPPARYDLHLSLAAVDDGMRASLLYDAALFDAATVTRWLVELRELLAAVADDPSTPLAHLDERLACGARKRRARDEEGYADALLSSFESRRKAGAAS